jgi:hypothetical protein
MQKMGDELRASSRRRLRLLHFLKAMLSERQTDQAKMMQFIITIRLPVITVKRIM